MRRPIIAGNWKMHKTVEEAVDFVARLRETLGEWEETEVMVAPPFVTLVPVVERLSGSKIEVAAQNVFWEVQGAYTGEVSPTMLHAVGCRYVIIGHSERRAYFGETDETVNRKVKATLANGLNPIVCVGESLEERERGDTFNVVKRQVTTGLKGMTGEVASRIVIAYEPIWAIGTGKTASPGQAQEVHLVIRRLLGEIFDSARAEDMRIQYGGSVKPDNIDALMSERDIDGALVGGASLEIESFVRIVKFVST